ncbi:MAG: hypothetical protein ACETWR_10565 [Anaerolineae bacterium]
MGKLINLLLSALLAPLIYSFLYEACLFFIANADFYLVSWFTYGFLFYIVIYILILQHIIDFIEIFEHELGHAIVAWLFLKDVREFWVSPEGGKVNWLDGSDSLITLAPYYLPVFTIPLAVIQPFVFYPIHLIIDFLIGFTLAFHYAALFRKEFRWSQSDIKKTGRIFSFCVVCILNIIVLVIILCIVSRNYLGILNYFKNSFARTPESYQTALRILTMLSDLADQLLHTG